MAPKGKTGGKRAAGHDQPSRGSKISRTSALSASATGGRTDPLTVAELKDIVDNPAAHGYSGHPLLEIVKEVSGLTGENAKKDPKERFEQQFARYESFANLHGRFCSIVEGSSHLPPDSNRLKNTTSTKLAKNLRWRKLPGFLRFVGLDTTDVVHVGHAEGLHQVVQ